MNRWDSSALTGTYEIPRSTKRIPILSLPLSFGFGEDFHGFQGTLDLRKITTKDFTDPTDANSYSLLVDPYNTDTDHFQRLLWQWLKQTLSRSSSMQQWLDVCCPRLGSSWIRDILEASWHYFVKYLYEDAKSNPMNELLANAWFMTFLSTMLSRPIEIPWGSRQRLFDELKNLGHKDAHLLLPPSISRVANRIFKSTLLFFYQHLIAGIVSRLHDWHTHSLRDYGRGHIECIFILIMVVFSQMEAALHDDYGQTHLSNHDSSFEDHVSHIVTMDSVLKTIMVYMRHKCRESMKRPRDADEANDNVKEFGQYRVFAERVEEIRRNYGKSMFTIRQ